MSDFSSNNLVVGNTVSNNQIGIKIIGSNYTYFYHNSFIDNINNHYAAMEYHPVNFWNNSFGEGNYWSNYTGTDANHDGIGDTPHILYAGNQDFHPLMSPFIPADANHDGIVNIKDVNFIGIAWNTTKGTPKYNPHADLNMDNVINMADADVIKKNWQKTIKPQVNPRFSVHICGIFGA
ncbi:MAG: NosD domain-containing protein, partial [Candidatus Bathyarchaeia archaeon]